MADHRASSMVSPRPTCASRPWPPCGPPSPAASCRRRRRWSRPSCPSSSRSAAARSARRCGSCSRRDCWSPLRRGRLYVRRLGPKEIVDIFAVRASLEGLAASIARRAGRPAGSRRPSCADCSQRDGPGRRRRGSRGADRVRPRLPPQPVPPHRQRDPAAHLGRTRRARSGCRSCTPATTALSATWTSPVTTPSSTPSRPATPPPPPRRPGTHGLGGEQPRLVVATGGSSRVSGVQVRASPGPTGGCRVASRPTNLRS